MWFLTSYGICSKVSAILALGFSIGPILDLNQNGGLGHTLFFCQYSTLAMVQKYMYAHTYAMHISMPS